jgi:hypothetical protein
MTLRPWRRTIKWVGPIPPGIVIFSISIVIVSIVSQRPLLYEGM